MNLKFLADVNIENPIIDFLRAKNINVKCVEEFDKRLLDIEIIALARKEHRIILTNDKDFGELTFYRKEASHGIVLFRVKGQNANEKKLLLTKLLRDYSDKLNAHFTTIKKDKFRFIKLTEL